MEDPEKIKSLVEFTHQDLMANNLIELRIDNHLGRILKNPSRLLNFCNAIRGLPIKSRINEKLIEIMNSSENFIGRKKDTLEQCFEVVRELRENHRRLEAGRIGDFQCKDQLILMLDRIKNFTTNTEQIIWAIDSNCKHLRYISGVYSIPDVYYRDDPKECIRMRERIVHAVACCSRIISICQLMRLALSSTMKNIYCFADDGVTPAAEAEPEPAENPFLPIICGHPEDDRSLPEPDNTPSRSNYVSSPIKGCDFNC